MTMERRKGVALWSQIATEVARAVEEGVYPPGGKLPTETQLAELYGVNRHTIRRALEELGEARIIRTEHGRGSFVAEPVLDYRIGARPRFSEWIRSHNRTPLGTILDLRETSLDALAEADAQVAAASLGLDAAARIILLDRLGAADDRPIVLSRHLFPARLGTGLLAALRNTVSITAALEDAGIEDYVRRWTRVCARTPAAREARLLRMARTDPVLACEALNTTPAGDPTEFIISAYPTPRVQLVFEIAEGGPGSKPERR